MYVDAQDEADQLARIANARTPAERRLYLGMRRDTLARTAGPEPARLTAPADPGAAAEAARLVMLAADTEFMRGADSNPHAEVSPEEFATLQLAAEYRSSIIGLTVTRSERERLAARGLAIPNDESGGDFPIPDRAHLANAVGRFHNGDLAGHSAAKVKRHLQAAARKLGLPDPFAETGHGDRRGSTRHASGVHHMSVDGAFGTGSGVATGGPDGGGGAAMSGYLRIGENNQALALTAADALLDGAEGVAENRELLALARAEAERDRAELAARSAFAPTSLGGTGRQGTGMNPGGAVRAQYPGLPELHDVGSAGDLDEDETDPEAYIADLRARHGKASGRGSTGLDELFGKEDYPVRGGTVRGGPGSLAARNAAERRALAGGRPQHAITR